MSGTDGKILSLPRRNEDSLGILDKAQGGHALHRESVCRDRRRSSTCFKEATDDNLNKLRILFV
jgi:hypothetical protein